MSPADQELFLWIESQLEAKPKAPEPVKVPYEPLSVRSVRHMMQTGELELLHAQIRQRRVA